MGMVRGVLLARPGAEGATGGTLQELVRRLPGDLFRTCLARVGTGTRNPRQRVWPVHSSNFAPCGSHVHLATTSKLSMREGWLLRVMVRCTTLCM